MDGIFGHLGLLNRPLDPEALIRIAQRHTGLTEFGDSSFIDPLRRFLDSSINESSLSLVGRLATRWDVVRFLSNLLQLQEAERCQPAILQERIERPIFITGLPRSGTTFLHRLMMNDAGSRAPLVWQTIYPYPERGRPDRRLAQVTRQLHAFERLAPEFRALHPLEAVSPQECSEITAHVFRSLRFDTNYHVPSYRTWLDADAERNLPAFRFHKRFLQHLQHQSDAAPRQWVLKCPEHVFALEAIRAVYPDARLIFVHRDPLKVLLSVAKLTEVLRRPFTRGLDPAEIGRQESTRWLDGTRRMMRVGDDAGLPEPVCHIHYIDLISDPLATVEGVYQHFGMRLPAEAATSIQRYVAAKPNGGYGRHDYHFEDHGLDAQIESEKFRPYLLRFGITAEALPGRRGASDHASQQEQVAGSLTV
ncbi:MAG: sulfotransferase [Acetobacteraceae bacterium]|nr:sulfotransferase [Acetobacteraceae bacterium]